MIGGFELPTSGQILLGGKDISKLPPNERPINTVFQKYALFPYLNIYDNIAFGLKLKKLPKDVIDEKVRHVLDVVESGGFERAPGAYVIRWFSARVADCTCDRQRAGDLAFG